MMYEAIIGGVITIIGVAIVLGVGTSILGSTSSSFDCATVEGYVPNKDAVAASSGVPAQPATSESQSTGWAKTCLDTNEQSRQAWILIPVVMIVIAAVIILGTLRHFG